MVVCDMCGKENPKCPVIISEPLWFSNKETEHTVCGHCKRKLKRFIEFERARNNKH